MKTKKYLIIILASIMAGTSCKKTSVPNDLGEVSFFIEGKANNLPFEIYAGVNNTYMYTNYYTDSKNIQTYEGTIKSTDSNTIEPYFQIALKNNKIGPWLSTEEALPNTVFNNYTLDTANGILTHVKNVQFSFTGISQNIVNYNWNFGDGTSSTIPNPHHTFKASGIKNVSLTVTYANGSIDFLSNTINTDIAACQAQIYVTRVPNSDSIWLSATPGFIYNWQLPNGTTSTAQALWYTAVISNRNYFTLNTTGACNSIYKQVAVGRNSSMLCNFNYTATDSSYIDNSTPIQHTNTAIITYKKNGKTYLSYKNAYGTGQMAAPIFTITQKEFYQNNNANQRTLKLTGSLQTFLYNSANISDSIYVFTNRLQFAVAFP
jgi:PKD repeat protein